MPTHTHPEREVLGLHTNGVDSLFPKGFVLCWTRFLLLWGEGELNPKTSEMLWDGDISYHVPKYINREQSLAFDMCCCFHDTGELSSSWPLFCQGLVTLFFILYGDTPVIQSSAWSTKGSDLTQNQNTPKFCQIPHWILTSYIPAAAGDLKGKGRGKRK